MNTIELKVKYHYSDWQKGDDSKYHPVGKKHREEERKFNLYSADETDQLFNFLRMVDEDFDKAFGAWDKYLKYEILDITFRSGFASGKITREALDNKIGYKRLYPKS